MRFCTYIASDKPLSQSACLWPLSRGGEDIYTEKAYTAQIVPDLDDLSGVHSYIQNHMKTAGACGRKRFDNGIIGQTAKKHRDFK